MGIGDKDREGFALRLVFPFSVVEGFAFIGGVVGVVGLKLEESFLGLVKGVIMLLLGDWRK